MRIRYQTITSIILLSVFMTLTAMAHWDPGDGHKMHYPQLPRDIVNPDSTGLDIAFMDHRLADDWRCSETGPVNDIHFWISWHNNEEMPISDFRIRIYSDNPVGPGGFSIPDILLWEHWFVPGEYTIRPMEDHLQDWFDPWSGEYLPGNHHLWHQINIDNIQEPLHQVEGTIYWLEVLFPVIPTVGWKVSGRAPFRDNAVFMTGNGWLELVDPITMEPIDLAFVITEAPIEGCWLCCPLEGNILIDPTTSGQSSVDFNDDFIVNIADFAMFINCLFGPYDPCCDYNCDGASNIADFAIFASHYQHAGSVFCPCP